MDLFEEECRFFELPEEAIQGMKPKKLEYFEADDGSYSHQSTTIRSQMWDILQKLTSIKR